LEYDWDRITLVQKKYSDVLPGLRADLDRFLTFLHSLTAT